MDTLISTVTSWSQITLMLAGAWLLVEQIQKWLDKVHSEAIDSEFDHPERPEEQQ